MPDENPNPNSKGYFSVDSPSSEEDPSSASSSEDRTDTSQSFVERMRNKRAEEKAQDDSPSVWNDLVKNKDENGNKRSFSERMQNYTEDTIRHQQKQQTNQEKNPIPVKRYLIIVGIVVIMFLLLLVTQQCHAAAISELAQKQSLLSNIQSLLHLWHVAGPVQWITSLLS